MRALIPKHDFVPQEIQAIQVRGHVSLYYQLPDLDWLLVFTRPDQDYQTRARNSMNGADPEVMNQIVKGELGDKSWIWPYVGLREGVILITAKNPAEDSEVISVEAAKALSEGVFGVQGDAPRLKTDPRTKKLQEVVVEAPIVAQEAEEPAPEPDETTDTCVAEPTQETEPEG